MSKIINRLYEYLDYKGVAPTRFEKNIGLSNGYLGTQLKRDADLGESILNKIIDNCLDLNVEWLVAGKNCMLKIDVQEQMFNNSEVSILLHKLELMYLLPNYINITSDPAKFKKLFFDAAIKFVTELKFTEEQARYIASNFDSGLKYIKPEELIEKLREIQQNGDTDSTYYIMLGFRSLWFLLNNNKDNVSLIFVDEVTEILHPFFLSTQCPIEYSIRY